MTTHGKSKNGGYEKRNEKKTDFPDTCTNFKILSSRSFSLLNKLANLFIALFYAYTLLHHTPNVSSDVSWLKWFYGTFYVKRVEASIADTQTRAQRCFDYIFLHGKSLVLLEEPTLSKIDLTAVSKMEKEIQEYLAKLEETAKKENDELLLELVTEIHSVFKLRNSNNVSYQYKKDPPSIVDTMDKSADVLDECEEDTGYFGSTMNEDDQRCTSTPVTEATRQNYRFISKHKNPILSSTGTEEILYKWKPFQNNSLDSPGQHQSENAGIDHNKIDYKTNISERVQIQGYDIEIHHSDMSKELLKEVIQIYITVSNKVKCKACGNKRNEVEVATLMKKELDAKEGIQEWMVVVGEKYGVVVTHQNQTFANFTSNTTSVVISKPRQNFLYLSQAEYET